MLPMTAPDFANAEKTRAPDTYLHALDLDSHEFMPTHFYPGLFGETGQLVMEIMDSFRADQTRENNMTRPDISADDYPIDPSTIWSVKGPQAPGAINMQRRLEVLDAMGVDRQLVFPTFGFIAFT